MLSFEIQVFSIKYESLQLSMSSYNFYRKMEERKERFIKMSKNLTRYKFENNFGLSK